MRPGKQRRRRLRDRPPPARRGPGGGRLHGCRAREHDARLADDARRGGRIRRRGAGAGGRRSDRGRALRQRLPRPSRGCGGSTGRARQRPRCADRRARRAERSGRCVRPHRGRRDRGGAHARTPRAHRGHGHRAGPRSLRRRGRAADRTADRARRPGAGDPHGSLRSRARAPAARRRARSTTPAACSSSAARPA